MGGINPLNLKQRKVFNVIDSWVNDYVKHNEHNVASIHIFLSTSGSTVKFGESMFNAKTFLSHYKDLGKSNVLSLGPTEG